MLEKTQKDKITQRKTNTEELIDWVHNLTKKINYINIPVFAISTLLTLRLYNTFFKGLTTIAISLNSVLPTLLTTFTITCISGGILVFTNGTLIISKIGLKQYNKKLTKKLVNLDNKISKKENIMQLGTTQDITPVNITKEQNNYQYKYNGNNHHNNNDNTNFILLTHDEVASKKTEQIKKKIKSKFH